MRKNDGFSKLANKLSQIQKTARCTTREFQAQGISSTLAASVTIYFMRLVILVASKDMF